MSDVMPLLFVGHGSPTNAVEENEFNMAWAEVGRRLPRPQAILCISAHWETVGTCVTAMPRPATLYDFQGFAQPLYEIQYPAPGAPELARGIKQTLTDTVVHLDFSWGLDHGAWSVLTWMFPDADIPVIQLSLDFDRPPAYHYQLGRKLAYLRRQGVLVIGSGNMVHNLRLVQWEDIAFDWAAACDARLAELILRGDHAALIDYQRLENAPRAVPSNEHYLPLLYILAMQEKSETPVFFCEKVTLGSISMRSLLIAS
jgi:4,5-DOPA dioxygenase extradiol